MPQSDLSPGSTSPASDTRDASRIREAIAKANKVWNNQQQQPDSPGGSTVPVAAAGAIGDVAAATIQLSQGTWRTIPALSQAMALTVATTGAQNGDQIQISKTDVSQFAVTINGGLVVLPAGVREDVVLQFDGAAWALRKEGVPAVLSGTAGPLAGNGVLAVAVPGLAATAHVMITLLDGTNANVATTGYRVSAVAANSFTIQAMKVGSVDIGAADATALFAWVAVNP